MCEPLALVCGKVADVDSVLLRVHDQVCHCVSLRCVSVLVLTYFIATVFDE
jgi:hypothetical protein